MDKLISLVSSLEAAIRYLLSGAVIATIGVMSRNDPWPIFQWALSNQAPTALCVSLIGFTSFSIYRLLLWVVFDPIAWKSEASAPALFSVKGLNYSKPYAKFLRWKHSPDLPQALSGYLTYRWSVAHFASVSGMAGFFFAFLGQCNSFIVDFQCWVAVVSFIVAGLGFWQIYFLYRVERELCRSVATAQGLN